MNKIEFDPATQTLLRLDNGEVVACDGAEPARLGGHPDGTLSEPWVCVHEGLRFERQADGRFLADDGTLAHLPSVND